MNPIIKNIIKNIDQWLPDDGVSHFPRSKAKTLIGSVKAARYTHVECLESGWPAVVLAASSVTDEQWDNFTLSKQLDLVYSRQLRLANILNRHLYYEYLSYDKEWLKKKILEHQDEILDSP